MSTQSGEEMNTRYNLLKRYAFALFVLFSISVQSSLAVSDLQVWNGPGMNINRMGHFSFVLPDGRVVLAGGRGTGFVSLNTADVYDPVSKSFVLDTMAYIHDFGAVCELNDGTWLVAGGSYDLGVAPGITGAEIYDPAAGTFTSTGSMSYARCVASAVRLANNKALVIGGWYDASSATYAEVYDPAGKSFAATGPLNGPRSNALAIATDDSGAVVFGGYHYYGSSYYESVEYYNPATNNFSVMSDSLLPGEAGWCVQQDMYSHPMSEQRMWNGQYLLHAWRATPSEYTLMTFDATSKTFARFDLPVALPSTDSVLFWRAPILDSTRTVAYWFGFKVGGDPTVMNIYRIDLVHRTWVVSESYTSSHYWSGIAMNMLHDGTILVTGGTTSNDYGTNFNPVAGTTCFLYTPVTGIKEEPAYSGQPGAFRLEQNYPNPFNPSTTITYQVSDIGYLKLAVYDILGREVAVLAEGQVPVGTHSVTWNGSGMAGGVYFCRLEAGAFVQTRKMLLAK
jgi:hypothetical protein